jgi:hypothetical protein
MLWAICSVVIVLGPIFVAQQAAENARLRVGNEVILDEVVTVGMMIDEIIVVELEDAATVFSMELVGEGLDYDTIQVASEVFVDVMEEKIMPAFRGELEMLDLDSIEILYRASQDQDIRRLSSEMVYIMMETEFVAHFGERLSDALAVSY